MAETCIVCNKKIGFTDSPFPVELETGETKDIHYGCRNRYFGNPEEFGGPLSAQSVTVTSSLTHKPSIIDTLSALGWLVFVISGLSGIFYIFLDGGGIFGVSLIIAGVFQLSIFLGFSAIIDQLYKINVNTSKSDKSDS
jgi:hypothetical protein